MPDEYHVESSRKVCSACGREFAPNDQYASALVEAPPEAGHQHGLARLDFCLEHVPAAREGWLGFWRTRVPVPDEPAKRRFVIDDERLLDLFFRLAETAEAAKLDLRYVIGLMLLRRRRLKLEGRRRRGNESYLLVRKTRTKKVFELLDRHLGDEAIAAVSGEIGSVLDLAETIDLEGMSDESQG